MPYLKKIFVLFVTILLSSIFISNAQEKGRINPAPIHNNTCTFVKWFDPHTNDKEGKLLLKNCSSCHMTYYKEWKDDKHSMSQNNPLFLAVYKQFREDHPNQNGNCALCHNPEAVLNGKDAPVGHLNGDIDLRKRNAKKTNGISCDFCHKIENVDQDPFKKGVASLKLFRVCKGMKDIRFGPIKDPIQPGKYEELKYNSIYKTSLVCAKCHDSSNGNVQIYSTFTEWINSPAAKRGVQCQACHMKPTGKNEIVDNPDIKHKIRPYHQIHSHTFLTNNPHEFRKKYVDMKIAGARRRRAPDNGHDIITVTTTVSNNNFGHSFPTGSTMRNAILVIDVKCKDRRGEVTLPLQIKGSRLPNYAGDLKGKPGKLFAKILSETSGEYAARHGDAGIKFRKIMDKLGIPAQDWWNVFILQDTRIKANESDISVYEFEIANAEKCSVEVTSTLRWRNTWPGLAKIKRIKLEEDLLIEKKLEFTPNKPKVS